jgi:hypothetical protein
MSLCAIDEMERRVAGVVVPHLVEDEKLCLRAERRDVAMPVLCR